LENTEKMFKLTIILSLFCVLTQLASSRSLNDTIVGGIGQELNPHETEEILKVLKENVKSMKDEKKQDVALK
jgi:hypothetical protein